MISASSDRSEEPRKRGTRKNIFGFQSQQLIDGTLRLSFLETRVLCQRHVREQMATVAGTNGLVPPTSTITNGPRLNASTLLCTPPLKHRLLSFSGGSEASEPDSFSGDDGRHRIPSLQTHDTTPVTSGPKQNRKRRRGVIEKKRRDRINNCLNELRRLVPSAFEKQGSQKLEKAEILQLTVEYIASLHSRGVESLVCSDPNRATADYQLMGFRECATEVARFLQSQELDTQDPLRTRLMNHLQTHMTYYAGAAQQVNPFNSYATQAWISNPSQDYTNSAVPNYQISAGSAIDFSTGTAFAHTFGAGVNSSGVSYCPAPAAFIASGPQCSTSGTPGYSRTFSATTVRPPIASPHSMLHVPLIQSSSGSVKSEWNGTQTGALV